MFIIVTCVKHTSLHNMIFTIITPGPMDLLSHLQKVNLAIMIYVQYE